MAGAAEHAEDVENFVGAKLLVPGVKEWQFQGIDYAADGVNNAAPKEPEEAGQRQGLPKTAEYEYTDPSHGNIDEGGKPFGAGDPEGFDQDSCDRNSPYGGKQCIAYLATEDDETDRGVGAGYQHKDHHVIDFAKKL